MKKKLLIFALFIASIFISTQTVSADDVFKVGMEAAYPPYNWSQQNDANGAVPIEGTKEYAAGYDIEVAKQIAKDLDKELVIVKTEWDGLLPALTSGKIDAIIAGMSPTEERKQSIDFSDSYYDIEFVVMVKKGTPYEEATSISDFQNAKITAQLGTVHYDLIDQIPDVNKQTAMDNFSAMRVALEAGTIDGYVSELSEGITATEKNPNFTMIRFNDNKGFSTTPDQASLGIGLRKNDPNLASINQTLANISIEKREELMTAAIEQQPSDDQDNSWFQTITNIVKSNWKLFLRGAGLTLLIALIGTITGSLIGLGIGFYRTIPIPENNILNLLYRFGNMLFSIYIEVFRGTPMIVQAMVIYYGSAQAFGLDINRTLAAIIIVSINTGAYMTEIVRGGIFAVDKGQFEAAQAIGMTHWQTMTNVVIPQVVRNILPATGNEFVINIKDTSVLNVIAVSELFFQAKTVASANFKFFETFFVVCVLYFVMTFSVTRILRLIEKSFDGPDFYAPISNQMQTTELKDPKQKEDN